MKSHDKFEYDLWTETQDGHTRYFARVKATGEVTELTAEQISELRRFEHRDRKYSKQENGTVSKPLSLEAVMEIEGSERWLTDQSTDVESAAVTKMLEDEFLETLTEKERHLFLERRDSDTTLRAYSRRIQKDYHVIWDRLKDVERKFKKFVG